MRTVALNAWCVALGIAVSAAAGCEGCGCGSETDALRVQGDDPFVRCLAAEPPAERRWKTGGLSLRIEGRSLEVQGISPPIAVAAFRGPGPSPRPLDEAVETLASDEALDLAIVLGGLGPREEAATRNVQALAALEVPVLVLAGGRDEAADLNAAFDALGGGAADRVLDARALWEVHMGRETLILVSGAPKGRYARSADACGYRPADLEHIAEWVGDPGDEERRWLVSWAVPAGGLPAHGYGGVPVGDAALADLREAIRARGGVYAWPGTQAMAQAVDGGSSEGKGRGGVAVARIAGPAVERADGSRIRGVARLELGGGRVSAAGGRAP